MTAHAVRRGISIYIHGSDLGVKDIGTTYSHHMYMVAEVRQLLAKKSNFHRDFIGKKGPFLGNFFSPDLSGV